MDGTLNGEGEKASRPRQIKRREKRVSLPWECKALLCKGEKIQGEGITNLVIKLAEHENNPIKHNSDFTRGLYTIYHSKHQKNIF